MQQDVTKRNGRPSPAMVVAVIALIVALGGSAFAASGALDKNSVGSRQLKAKAVTTGKIANSAVNGAKVANKSLTGEDINIGALGEVPNATNASNAVNASSVGGHSAACPAATVLIRGVCFDASANASVANLQTASDACAAKGGYLPTPMELYSTHNVLNLGSGTGTDHQYTDSIYANTNGGKYSTVVVYGTGILLEQEASQPSKYTCAYALVR